MSKKIQAHTSKLSSKLSSEQPPTKRVKVSLACTLCRKKKVKCNGAHPTCSRCEAVGLACEYTDPPRKRGPPKGHVEVIESRVHRIESLLGKRRSDSTSRMEQTVSSNGIPVNTVLHLIASEVARSRSEHTPGSHEWPFRISSLEPPYTRRSAWVDHFFNHFNLIFPLLSRHHFLHALLHNPQAMDPLLQHAVFALGCLYADPNDSETARQMFAHCEHLLITPRPVQALSIVQALTIMCWHAFLSGDISWCDRLRVQLVRLVGDLNLCHDPDTRLGIVQVELRRRAFWVVYVMDQWLSVALGYQCLSYQNHWSCKWPKLEDSQLQAIDSQNLDVPDLGSHLAFALQIVAFPEMIKLAQIVDIFLTTHVPMASSLTFWLLGLPSYLQYGNLMDDNLPSPVAHIYHILYYTVQIFVSSPHSASSLPEDRGRDTEASTIIHMAEQMIQAQQTRHLCTISMLSLTLAASVHLSYATEHAVPDYMNLAKSLSVFKYDCCFAVPRPALNRALGSFALGQCNAEFSNQAQTTPSIVCTTSVSRNSMTSNTDDLSHLDALLGLDDLFYPNEIPWVDPLSWTSAAPTQTPAPVRPSCVSSTVSTCTLPESLTLSFSSTQLPTLS